MVTFLWFCIAVASVVAIVLAATAMLAVACVIGGLLIAVAGVMILVEGNLWGLLAIFLGLGVAGLPISSGGKRRR
jgi:hypothetical protein